MIKTNITDGSGSKSQASCPTRDDETGLLVYTKPYRICYTQRKFATNELFGNSLNQSVAFSGTPNGIHNGVDSTLWTATALSGTWTFNSTAQAFAGTRSIDGTATKDNNVAQLAGSAISTSTYSAFSGAIYITKWDNNNKNVELELRSTGTLVSSVVSISDYVDVTLFGTWQTFAIPMVAFAAGGISFNQMRIRTIKGAGGKEPDYYLDALQFEEAGSAEWTLLPDPGTIFRIDRLRFSLVDVYDSTLANATMPKLTANSLLGVGSLTNGIRLQIWSGGVSRVLRVYQNLGDFLSDANVSVTSGGDATNTWMNIDLDFQIPIELKAGSDDRVNIHLSDNLSGLTSFKLNATGSTEDIQ